MAPFVLLKHTFYLNRNDTQPVLKLSSTTIASLPQIRAYVKLTDLMGDETRKRKILRCCQKMDITVYRLLIRKLNSGQYTTLENPRQMSINDFESTIRTVRRYLKQARENRPENDSVYRPENDSVDLRTVLQLTINQRQAGRRGRNTNHGR